MTTGDPPLRIGTAERTAAMTALDEHLAAGRLGIDEYADRSAIAANATVASELAALFTDLPLPHPELPGTTATLPSATLPSAALPSVPPPQPAATRFGGLLDGVGPRVVAVMPFVALVLFFATGLWYWFLLIPAAGALVYGTSRIDWNGDDEGRRDREPRRDRR